MNLCDLILLNFLAWIRISATMNYVELRNIFRVKRDITNLCSDKVKVKLTYPCLKEGHDQVGQFILSIDVMTKNVFA